MLFVSGINKKKLQVTIWQCILADTKFYFYFIFFGPLNPDDSYSWFIDNAKNLNNCNLILNFFPTAAAVSCPAAKSRKKVFLFFLFLNLICEINWGKYLKNNVNAFLKILSWIVVKSNLIVYWIKLNHYELTKIMKTCESYKFSTLRFMP